MKRILASLVVIAGLFAGLAAPVPVRAWVEPIDLNEQGWSDPSVGTWDPATRTATLQVDLTNRYIDIIGDGITLEGNGHTITAAEQTWSAVNTWGNGITIKNVTVEGAFSYGIMLNGFNNALVGNRLIGVVNGIVCFGGDGLVSGNTVQTADNGFLGIYLMNGTRFTLRDNHISNSMANLAVNGPSPEYYDHDIDTSNLIDGKRVYYIKNATGQVLDGLADAGTVYLVNCDGMTVRNLSLTRNMDGVCLVNTHNSRVENVQTDTTAFGIRLVSSNNNTIVGNTAANYETGIWLDGSTGNVLTGNTTNGGWTGISVSGGGNNTISGCTTTGNTGYGLQLRVTAGNQVYGNSFLSNSMQAYVEGGSGNLFNLPAPTGGNYWSDWTGPDANGDGFVDSAYVFTGGQDDLPLCRPTPADRDAPITSYSISGAMPGQWTVYDAEVTLRAADVGASGVKGTEYSFDGVAWIAYSGPFTVTNEGATTVHYRSIDNAGNVEEAKSLTVKIDKTLPVVTQGPVQGVAGNNNWYRSDVTVAFTAGDALSGLADPADASFVLTTNGEGNVQTGVRSICDQAGNEVVVGPLSFAIDKTPPVLTQGAVEGAAGSDGWYRSDVTVAFSAADAVSGLADAADASFALTTSGEGEAVATGTREVADVAGNVAVAGPLTFKIDKTPPVVIGAPTTQPNAAGWYNHEVTICWTASDALSGLDPSSLRGVCATITCAAPDPPVVVAQAVWRDLAGNEARGTMPPIRIDCTPPVVSIASPAPYAVLPVGTALQFDAGDALSGLAGLTAMLDNGTAQTPVTSGFTPTPGVYTLTVEAADKAGNRSVESRSFVIYDPNGGFVTGSGWIDSPAGAYAADSSLAGKASFGFVARYEQGRTVPVGQTEFRLKAANLSFRSTSYEWLAVTGARAQYKGVGTINGGGTYDFLLSVVDGEPDRLRLKVWDSATGAVAYDSQLGAQDNAEPATALGGGSIVVHQD